MGAIDPDFVVIATGGALISAVVIVAMLMNYCLHHFNIRWLPESVATMFLGGLAGLGALLIFPATAHQWGIFDRRIFFFVLLPPIILEAGYTLKRKNFFKNIAAILLYAVVGSLISAGLTGGTIFYFREWLDMSTVKLLPCLLFGSLISATESVAILAVLGNKDRPANPLLYSLVFGESVFNDAVCIVMYDVLYDLVANHEGQDVGASEISQAVLEFFEVSFGSIALGCVAGLACSFVFKRIHLHEHPATEWLLIFLTAFTAYCIAEIAAFSGVMSLFFCGIVLAHYNWYNISKESRMSTLFGISAISKGAECFVFFYLGFTWALSIDNSSEDYQWSFKLIMVTLVLAFVSRALYIFLFSGLDNCRRKPNAKITFKIQLIMILAGMRGAVAFALALNFPNAEEFKGQFITTTLAVSLTTLVGCGFLIDKLLASFGLVGEEGPSGNLMGDDIAFYGLGQHDSRSEQSVDGPIYSRDNATWFHWRQIDDNFLKPLFGGATMDRTYTVGNHH